MNEKKFIPWHERVTAKMNQLAEEFGLDPMSTQRLRDTVLEIAKAQYKVGNSCGIRWAHEQIEKRSSAVRA